MLLDELVVLRGRGQDVESRFGRRRELVGAVGVLLLLLKLRGHWQISRRRPAEVRLRLHLDAELLLQPLVERGPLGAGRHLLRRGRQEGAAAAAAVALTVVVRDSDVVCRGAVRPVVAAAARLALRVEVVVVVVASRWRRRGRRCTVTSARGWGRGGGPGIYAREG